MKSIVREYKPVMGGYDVERREVEVNSRAEIDAVPWVAEAITKTGFAHLYLDDFWDATGGQLIAEYTSGLRQIIAVLIGPETFGLVKPPRIGLGIGEK